MKAIRPELPSNLRISSRYQITSVLGSGGMGDIYAVKDLRDERSKALKRLRRQQGTEQQAKKVEQFQREFHTLVQLRHPRIVAVYDYGVEGGDPYYTMELLDGGDLMTLAPIPWQRACAIARDLCSALSLLHSRQLVYRDLSPRNVLCTGDDQAKLVDFGAVTPVGPSRQVIGTPSFCAPEVLEFRHLDARADLYSLGATLYYALTGQSPFPARSFAELRHAWLTPALPAKHFVDDIPSSLDRLLTDLLHLDPNSRPGSAAEIMERLNGIAELPLNEQLPVAQAYLTTTAIVGRVRPLQEVLDRVRAGMRGKGSTLLITATQGLGRSRFIDEAILQAKFEGMLVLRADAVDAQSGDYGLVRALCSRLLELTPEDARDVLESRLPVLGHAVPELLRNSPTTVLASFENPAQLRPRVQTALREWFEAVARERPLLLAIDDLQDIDGPSAAFVAVVGRQTENKSIVVVATTDSGSVSNAEPVKLLAQAARTLKLNPLTSQQTRELLESVFGSAIDLEPIAAWVHELSAGNARDVMRLAQHLVDRGIVTYQAGAWFVARAFDQADLPESVNEALRSVVSAISPGAHTLAHALALASDHSFTLVECSHLADHMDLIQVMSLLDELMSKGIVAQQRELYRLHSQRWVSLLRQPGSHVQSMLHARLADIFEGRGNYEFVAARHMFEAGHDVRATVFLVDHAAKSQLYTDKDADSFVRLVSSLTPDWHLYYDRALQVCDRERRPKLDAFLLLTRMGGFLGVMGVGDTTYLSELLQQLYVASGLDIYASLPDSLDPSERLKRTFELAQHRHQSSPPEERTLDPFAAIRQLARALIQAVAVIVMSRNLEFLRSLPSLVPYLKLSPALAIVQQIVDGVGNRYSGRTDQSVEIYRACLKRLAEPDRGGLDESHHHHAGFGIRYGLGLLEASIGTSDALLTANELETSPLYEVSAWYVRMLYHLTRAEIAAAERCRRNAELVRVQNHAHQLLDGGHLPIELCAHVMAANVLGVKRSLATIDAWAEKFPAWEPIVQYARAEYHRLRGDHASALAHFQFSLGRGEHQLWANAAGGEVMNLFEMQEYDRAVGLGTQSLSTATRRGLGSNTHLIELPLAWAEFGRGRFEQAEAYASSALHTLERLGATGLRVAKALAVRSRIAGEKGDKTTAEEFVDKMRAQFGSDANRKILARYEALSRPAATDSAASRGKARSRSRVNDTRRAGSGSELDTQLTTTTTLDGSGDDGS